jgi:hypothetical protein
MSRKALLVILIASLLLNVAAVGGFVYVRYYLAFHARLAPVSRRLELDAAGQARLVQFRRDAWAVIRESRPESASVLLQLNQAIATAPAGDPALEQALQRLGDTRRARQEKMVGLIIAFRDGLPPESRKQFNEMAKDPGFVLELLGLRLGPEP